MIESPEPIHRPGRLELQGLALAMGHSGNGVTFDVEIRDRSGSRCIFLTSRPFHVVTHELIGSPLHIPGALLITIRPFLTIALNDTVAGTSLVGTLALPVLPAFAEDP
jgi:hypothetical protein